MMGSVNLIINHWNVREELSNCSIMLDFCSLVFLVLLELWAGFGAVWAVDVACFPELCDGSWVHTLGATRGGV